MRTPNYYPFAGDTTVPMIDVSPLLAGILIRMVLAAGVILAALLVWRWVRLATRGK
jgi:hypothetical protein